MKNIVLTILSIVMVEMSFAQELSGKVVDANSGEGIPFASVYLTGVQLGVLTDSIGQFNIDASIPDEVTVRFSAQLYKSKIMTLKRGSELTVMLESSHLEVDEVVVIMPSGVMQRDNTVRVDRLDIKELNAIPASNLAEAISNINGVQQASLGTGISKPVIRGMQGVRVLTVLDGLRIENQQWGGDHGLGISQVGIGAVEVIKGPSSLLYGADAFGGVLYLVDEKFAKQQTQEVTLASKFQGVNLGTTNTLQYKISKKNVHFNVAGLYSDFADFKLSNGRYLENSRYYDQGVKARLGINKNNWSMQARYLYSISRMGIPGAHGEEEEEEEEHSSEEFMIDSPSRNATVPAQFIQNHFMSIDNKFFIKRHKLDVMLGHTRNDLSEFEDGLDVPALRMKLNNTLYHVKFDAYLGDSWKLISGIQGMFQQNDNVEGLEEQLIPNFDQNDNGIYSVAYWDKGTQFAMQFGARYDIRNLYSNGFNQTYASPNFSVGARYRWASGENAKHILRFNISSGFRSPHVSELLVEGEHHGALRYEVGNPDLVSERATQFDLDYEFETEHLSFVVNPFYNYIQNYIQIEAQDSMIDDLQLFTYDQVDAANLYGIDFGVHYHPHFAHWLHIESSYSLIYGNSLGGQAISLMPQPRVNNLVKFNFKMKSKFKLTEIVLQHQYFFEQTRLASFETQSNSYNLVNLGLNFDWDMKYPLEIGVGAKNVLNETYVNHLSRLKNIGINEPGRNLYLRLRYTITGKLKVKPKMI